MILDIVQQPNPILRQVAAMVESPLDSAIQQLITDMEPTMHAAKGIGLAAPQVGNSLQLCVVAYQDGILALINPHIVKSSFLTENEEEGCLSIPGVYGLVKRPRAITVRFIDRAGQAQELKAKGLLARVIQHEMDHLNGILFVDKATNIHNANVA